MKKFNLITLLISMMLMWKLEVDAIAVKCIYKDFSYNYGKGQLNTCYVDNAVEFIGDNVKVDKVFDSSTQNSSFVQEFWLKSAKNLQRVPQISKEVFPSLISISITQSGLTELSKNDLKSYTNLRFLILSYNSLKLIHEDTFNENHNLEVIRLSNNQISHIDEKTFSHLSKLRLLHLIENHPCPSLFNANSRPEVQNLVQKIEAGVCNSTVMITTTSPNPLIQQNEEFKNEIETLKEQIEQLGTFKNQLDTCEAELKEERINFTSLMNENDKNKDKIEHLIKESKTQKDFEETMTAVIKTEFEQNACKCEAEIEAEIKIEKLRKDLSEIPSAVTVLQKRLDDVTEGKNQIEKEKIEIEKTLQELINEYKPFMDRCLPIMNANQIVG